MATATTTETCACGGDDDPGDGQQSVVFLSGGNPEIVSVPSAVIEQMKEAEHGPAAYLASGDGGKGEAAGVQPAKPVPLERRLSIDGISYTPVEPSFEVEAFVERSPDGRYARWEDQLGHGAHKVIFKAWDSLDGKLVAWNVVPMAGLPRGEQRRLRREVTILHTIRHDALIAIENTWETDDSVVFITPIVESGDLQKFVRSHPSIKLKVFKRLCVQILTGLQYLHTLSPPIIHRDIKCENILYDACAGQVKIGDLGLAMQLVEGPEGAKAGAVVASHGPCGAVTTTSTGATTTSTGVDSDNSPSYYPVGTPCFMAPEIYDGKYTQTIDIYSFGLCFLEMVTRRPPYAECTNPCQIYRKVHGGVLPESLSSVSQASVRDFILFCINRRADGSRPSAAEVLAHPFLTEASAEDDEEILTNPDEPTTPFSPAYPSSNALSTSQNYLSTSVGSITAPVVVGEQEGKGAALAGPAPASQGFPSLVSDKDKESISSASTPSEANIASAILSVTSPKSAFTFSPRIVPSSSPNVRPLTMSAMSNCGGGAGGTGAAGNANNISNGNSGVSLNNAAAHPVSGHRSTISSSSQSTISTGNGTSASTSAGGSSSMLSTISLASRKLDLCLTVCVQGGQHRMSFPFDPAVDDAATVAKTLVDVMVEAQRFEVDAEAVPMFTAFLASMRYQVDVGIRTNAVEKWGWDWLVLAPQGRLDELLCENEPVEVLHHAHLTTPLGSRPRRGLSSGEITPHMPLEVPRGLFSSTANGNSGAQSTEPSALEEAHAASSQSFAEPIQLFSAPAPIAVLPPLAAQVPVPVVAPPSSSSSSILSKMSSSSSSLVSKSSVCSASSDDELVCDSDAPSLPISRAVSSHKDQSSVAVHTPGTSTIPHLESPPKPVASHSQACAPSPAKRSVSPTHPSVAAPRAIASTASSAGTSSLGGSPFPSGSPHISESPRVADSHAVGCSPGLESNTSDAKSVDSARFRPRGDSGVGEGPASRPSSRAAVLSTTASHSEDSGVVPKPHHHQQHHVPHVHLPASFHGDDSVHRLPTSAMLHGPQGVPPPSSTIRRSQTEYSGGGSGMPRTVSSSDLLASNVVASGPIRKPLRTNFSADMPLSASLLTPSSAGTLSAVSSVASTAPSTPLPAGVMVDQFGVVGHETMARKEVVAPPLPSVQPPFNPYAASPSGYPVAAGYAAYPATTQTAPSLRPQVPSAGGGKPLNRVALLQRSVTGPATQSPGRTPTASPAMLQSYFSTPVFAADNSKPAPSSAPKQYDADNRERLEKLEKAVEKAYSSGGGGGGGGEYTYTSQSGSKPSSTASSAAATPFFGDATMFASASAPFPSSGAVFPATPYAPSPSVMGSRQAAFCTTPSSASATAAMAPAAMIPRGPSFGHSPLVSVGSYVPSYPASAPPAQSTRR